MSPIETHLVNDLTQELAAAGIGNPRVSVLSAEAENWRFRIQSADREFEIGFSHRDQAWCRETTPGRERHFVSNDQPQMPVSAEARALTVRLLAQAIHHPEFVPRDPPVI